MAFSHKTFFISDPHFGHKGIISFNNKQGTKIRPFKSVEEMDELIIQKWNKTVREVDKVYVLGDIAMNRKCIKTIDKCNGKKILVRGNHDIFKLEDYTPFFKDVRAYKVFPKYRIICSHIPIHDSQFFRFKLNIHGHLHQNLIDDDRYLNVCMEQTNFTPVSLEEILDHLGVNHE